MIQIWCCPLQAPACAGATDRLIRIVSSELVSPELDEDIHEAIVREKRMKDWHRQWKLRLIRKDNPYWRDLYEDINA